MNNDEGKWEFIERKQFRLEALMLLVIGFQMVLCFVLGYQTARLVSIFNLLGG